MTDVQERRDPMKQRVTVSTLVEVCGNIPGIPVFEAESVDVSPHGMHLRTAYLPESGAPLVCRFESNGREIVVEGTVAWRREGSRGGEFGVKFTALDARSVDVLKSLCGPAAEDDAAKPGSQLGEPGARVRLHIDGLGSPMKARVKAGDAAKVQVGSSLEFLKVGKRLELEDLDIGGRRAAEIDSVSVIVDPSTRIPQLVVALRFEGAEVTPSPSVADVGQKSSGAEGMRIPASAVTTDATHGKSAQSPERRAEASEEDGEHDDEPEMRGRFAAFAANAEEKAKLASERLARASSGAAHGAAAFFKGASAKLLSLKKREAAPTRRTTSPAPAHFSAGKAKLRPQTASSPSIAEPTRRFSRRTVAIAAGASLSAVGVLAFALHGTSAPPPGAHNAAERSTEMVAANATPSQATPGTQAANSNALGNAASTPNAPGAPAGAVTANVPLFGATPLATTEPAPLGPPPGAEAANVEASERAEAKASLAPQANDESFPEEADEAPSRDSHKAADRDARSDHDKSGKSSAKPEDVAPWGHGKMHEPVVYRLRLDGPGAKIVGTQESTGFDVVIPSRKIMESASGIAKRDERIAKVRTSNADGSAQVSFRFKDGVPSYRVRLRHDFVEFLISAPSKSASKDDKEPSHEKHGKHKSSH